MYGGEYSSKYFSKYKNWHIYCLVLYMRKSYNSNLAQLHNMRIFALINIKNKKYFEGMAS